MNQWIRLAALLAAGLGVGIGVDRLWLLRAAPPAQPAPQAQAQPVPPALPSMDSLPAEVARLKSLVPSNSHIMMDVQWHWTTLWYAAQAQNWELAQYMFNETRGHILWLTRKSPILRAQDGTDVDIQSIFEGIDTSSLQWLKEAIQKKDLNAFNTHYKTVLENCYSCHKSAGRPYLRPQLPTAQTQSILNVDPNATWPR
jgi:hypothetical protein